MMRLLITGAGGFVGRHMAAYAAAQGAIVFGIDRTDALIPAATLMRADLDDVAATEQALKATAPDAIIHLAARTPANSPDLAPQAWLSSTPVATVNLLEAARECCPNAAILIVSSSSVYGHVSIEQLPIAETFPIQPTTMYGVSKAVQELLAIRYAAECDMRVMRARPFNLLGPGEPRGMLTSALASQVVAIAAGTQPPLIRMRHRATSRDFTDVRDAVAAYWAILQHGRSGAVYNVCAGVATPIGVILDELLRLAGVTADVVETGAPAAGDILAQSGDMALLAATSGWRPRYTIEASLRDLLTGIQAT